MSLQSKRDSLLRVIDDPLVRERILPEWALYKPLITAWWDKLKETEAGDTLARAFHARRLVLRYIKTGESETVDMSAFHGEGGAKKDKVPRPTAIDPSLSPVKRLIALNNAASKPQYFKLGLGAKELVARTEPANFMPGIGGRREKIEMGLYDMSASLLDPRRAISAQTFNTISNGDIYAFMPLALPADQAVFQKLNAIGKDLRDAHPELYQLVREIRTRMTRIKLACEHDMGTNFTAFDMANTVNPRFRYGQSRRTKVPDPQAPTTLIKVDNTPAIIRKRQADAINYHAILTGAFTVNEITVAFREHRGVFPLFGVWSTARGLFIEKRLVDGKLTETGNTIADAPLLV